MTRPLFSLPHVLIRSFFAYFLCAFFAALPCGAESAVLSDDVLLDQIQRHSFDFFRKEADPSTGLVRDRAHNFKPGATSSPASIASVGFALTAYGVAVERGWMDVETARERTRRTLVFFLDRAPQEHGFFYHFLSMKDGSRASRSELSPIDTALFLAGALFAAEYFEDPEIRGLARKIYERVDWEWMRNGGKTLALAWSPESGFSKHRWDHYNESMILYLLAMGSPTHPVPAEAWKAIRRPVGSYRGIRVIQMSPLFTHQYSHIWVDFRNRNDGFFDYFQNSVNATQANRTFCRDQAATFKSYGENSWGLTASDGPFGYKAYGAPPGWAEHDGTIAPTGCGSSIVFTPEASIACLRHFYETHGKKLWGQYGFSDAFNIDRGWYDKDVIGIDQGALLLMIENYRTGLIWNVMKKSEMLKNAMTLAGFREGTVELPWPEPPTVKVPYAAEPREIDGYLKDWPSGETLILDKSFAISGNFKEDKDLRAEFRFAWDENYLYFAARIADDQLMLRRKGPSLWMDDAVEFFIDPAGDGFYWKNPKDFQLGFSPRGESDNVETWAWFQELDPSAGRHVLARGFTHEGGYLIEGRIHWPFLGTVPKAGLSLSLTPSVHDIDPDRSEGKFEWFLRSEEEHLRFRTGTLLLEADHETA